MIEFSDLLSSFQEPSVSFGKATIRTFDRIIVQISLDSKYVQHQKLALHLVEPKVGSPVHTQVWTVIHSF